MSAIALFMEKQKPTECEDRTAKSSRMSGPQGIKEMTGEITEVLRPASWGSLQAPEPASLFQALQIRSGSFGPFPALGLSPLQLCSRLSDDNMVLDLSEELTLWVQVLTIPGVRSRLPGAKSMSIQWAHASQYKWLVRTRFKSWLCHS